MEATTPHNLIFINLFMVIGAWTNNFIVLD